MRALLRVSRLLLVTFILAGCNPTSSLSRNYSDIPLQTAAKQENRTLTILAAASLTEPFTEIGNLFMELNPGVEVVISFAGSQQLAQQLQQGIKADLFASANQKYMDSIIGAERVDPSSVQIFTQNRLVVIHPAANPAGLISLLDLARPGIKLDLAAKEVPVGKYSLEFLDKASKDPGFQPDYKEKVLSNVVSYEDNVKSVLTKVLLGEVDAGIVYSSDVSTKDATKVGRMDIPDTLNIVATYPIAPIKDSINKDLAGSFVDLVVSEQGQAILEEYGFSPPSDQLVETNLISVTDALGREVSFDEVPQRIVLVGKALIMIADAIYLFPEAGTNIIALGSTMQGSSTFLPMIDPTFSEKISLDSNAGPEQIAAVQPDCVIMKSSNAEKLGTPLEVLNIPVVYLDFETPDQYQRDIKTLGQLFRNSDQAEKVAAYFQSKVDAITRVVSTVSYDQKPSTLILYYSENDGSVAFNVPPMSWMQTILVQTAGGLPVWEDANPGGGWTKVSLEQIAAWNPDKIFVVAYNTPINDVVNKLKADKQWQQLKALKNNAVYGFATDVYSWDQPDTRWILGLTWAAGKLHPDLFPGLDITKEAQAFYADLYGMDAESFQKKIQPLLSGDIN